jgi:hypothetical protein
MANIFDQINFNVLPSTASSQDVRMLALECDHAVHNEAVVFDISPLLSTQPYSGTDTYYTHGNTYSQAFQNDAFIYINTQLPYVDNGNITIYQKAVSSFSTPVIEEITIPNSITTFVDLQYPPLMNSFTARLKTTYQSTGQTTFVPYYKYAMAQLEGRIQFQLPADIGKTVIFNYVADRKMIPQLSKFKVPNYEYFGLNSQKQGVFKIYGRAFLSTNTLLYLKYTTTQATCQKCAGEGYVNDFFFDRNGRIQMVYDFSKLIQDFFKRFLTIKGSNPFDLSDGTIASDLVGLAMVNQDFIETTLKGEISDLLANIRSKQRSQVGFQTISPAEQIARLNKITITAQNVTDLLVTIEVVSLSGQTQQIKQVVKGS